MIAPEYGFRPARGDWLRAALVAGNLFVLYALTSPRTVATEDDGLFVLSSYFLGIEHAPGYPLFTLIGHLFTLLPVGSVAYRVHLASALFGGLACGAAWLCARSLTGARLPAYLAALGLGVAPVFWSQSIIAEVYTLNAFFFLTLVFLGLQAEAGRRVLPWMAFVFGLSLSNHWPLMLLVAPGFAVLLWPRLPEIARRLPLLLPLFAAGLLPYAWMVYRSWQEPAISYLGPLESWSEFWHVLSRASYATVDERLSASWLDRLRYFPFLGSQLFYQFAYAGAALVIAGFVAQWRVWGRRIGAFLLIAFLMPSAGLVLLLKFDYDTIQKHMFHVYPLPSYAVAALWLGLGFAWLAERAPLRRAPAAAGVALLALLLASGARNNLMWGFDWTARYAQTILRTLPPNALVFVQGDADLAPIAYFHMIENWRPDITLVQAKGLVLGNRRFHPLRADIDTVDRAIREMVDAETGPVVFILDYYSRYARRDRWLFTVLDKSSPDATQVTIDIPPEAVRFFEESVASTHDANGWLAFFQGELRRRYAYLLAQSLQRSGKRADARTLRQLDVLSRDFYGALGLAEGLIGSERAFPAGALADLLDKARAAMPADVPKMHLASYFFVRGMLQLELGDRRASIADLETALDTWSVEQNPALPPLRDLLRQAGEEARLAALEQRVHHGKR